MLEYLGIPVGEGALEWNLCKVEGLEWSEVGVGCCWEES